MTSAIECGESTTRLITWRATWKSEDVRRSSMLHRPCLSRATKYYNVCSKRKLALKWPALVKLRVPRGRTFHYSLLSALRKLLAAPRKRLDPQEKCFRLAKFSHRSTKRIHLVISTIERRGGWKWALSTTHHRRGIFLITSWTASHLTELLDRARRGSD